MSKRYSRLLGVAIVVAALLAAGPACSKKAADAGWKAKIEIVNGVKTIRNPETPRYGVFAFDLVEDLAIGDEKDEARLFPQGAWITVDGEGLIYICDYGNRRVQVYDKTGVFLRTLGRVGQGPGEYAFPSGVFIDESGNALISDARSIVVFDREGRFQKKIVLRTFLNGMVVGPGGTIVGTTQPNPRAEGGPKHALLQLSQSGEILRTLAEFPAHGASPGQMLLHWYSGNVGYCARSGDSLFYGYALDYLIHVVDGEGRKLFAFSKAEDAQGISGEEADLTRKEGIWAWLGQGDPKTSPLDLPDHRPYFGRLYSDDLGRLYVVRFKPITEKDVKTSDIDVFSKDGYYLYRMTWPFVPQVIKGGCLYEVRQDEDAGLTRIIRHRIRNWSDFKTE
jgi:hypothetical protein